MNKGELIAFVQKELDETKAGAERCVNAVIDGIKKVSRRTRAFRS